MDVVVQNIRETKGRVEVSSIPGQGATFTIKIPLTLAIIEGMLLRSGEIKYTLPIRNIQEIVKVTKDEIDSIFVEQEIIRIRGKLIPVVSLSRLHSFKDKLKSSDEGVLIIISARDVTIALLVEELLGQQQAVVKPLPRFFSEVKGVAGCTILGDGEISLILDVASLVDIALNISTSV